MFGLRQANQAIDHPQLIPKISLFWSVLFFLDHLAFVHGSLRLGEDTEPIDGTLARTGWAQSTWF